MMVDGIEYTGPVVRVWLIDATEDTAADAAREALGVSASADVVDHGAGRFECIFELGDIA